MDRTSRNDVAAAALRGAGGRQRHRLLPAQRARDAHGGVGVLGPRVLRSAVVPACASDAGEGREAAATHPSASSQVACVGREREGVEAVQRAGALLRAAVDRGRGQSAAACQWEAGGAAVRGGGEGLGRPNRGQQPRTLRDAASDVRSWDKDREAEIELAAVDGEEGVSGAVSQLPRNGAFAARPAFSVIASTNNGVAGGGGGHKNALALTDILRVATLPSKMLYHRVVAEVVGEDATLLVSRRQGNTSPELVVQVGCERSLLVGSDGFYTWYDETGRPQHRFTRETIPPTSTIDTKSTSNSVASLCLHIEYVLQAFKCPAEARSHDPPSSPLQKEELELVEESENEHGRFRAFRDGRVRVAFADRTILQVERDGDCCSFFFADGSSTQTTLASAPLRHRAYIYQALEFGDWAFSPQDERMQRHVKRQEVEAIVAQELQRINVRCSMNSQQEMLQQKCTKDTTVRKDQDDTDRKDMTLSLSLAAVRELQAATLQHIASVDHVLQMAASAAANDA
ncbi:hypothetical protein ON010_g14248 [Phytophthora cinnamomi]|nr:hypothetical protein ON010_g14248 [Phytophthora cinnamomi]